MISSQRKRPPTARRLLTTGVLFSSAVMLAAGSAAASPLASVSAGLGTAATTAAPAHSSSTLPADPAPTAQISAGTLESGRLDASPAGGIDYTTYLPPGYDPQRAEPYPVVYLLHGRGDSQAAWQRLATRFDELILAEQIQPLIFVMPDAPWNERGNWYTDSTYTGSQFGGGVRIETAFTADLVAHIDATYHTVVDRSGRAVGGYSMGGAGALRFTLAHPETFSAGIVLSPASYSPGPPSDSSVREYGAYGVGDDLFDEDRYVELSYPTMLAEFDGASPVHLFIAVGDDEWANPHPADAQNDIDFESAKIYNQARRVTGITAELRIMDGGHGWDVWQPGFEEAIKDVSQRLRTTAIEGWEAELIGSAGDDRAGGIAVNSDGSRLLGLNLAGAWDGHTGAGETDALLVAREASGAERWRQTFATVGNDRIHGLIAQVDGTAVVSGFTRGDLNTGEARGNDDAFVASVSADGELNWVSQFGDPAAADRLYDLTSDGSGGVFTAGYTSGSVGGATNAGDKDILLSRIDAGGQIVWVQQFGGPGEDKAHAIAATDDGGFVVAGVHGAGLTSVESAGGYDGWVASFDAAGEQRWIRGVGSDAHDQVNGVTVLSDGTIVAVGNTRGTLGAAHLGDHDIFVRAYDPAGEELWTTQTGTSTDDRGVTAAETSPGHIQVVATTYGAIGEPVGGVDVAVLTLSGSGQVLERTQVGSVERDGADEWDEHNLFAAAGPLASGATAGGDGQRTQAGSSGTALHLVGLTFGAPSGAVNAGSADIFVMALRVVGTDPGDPGGNGNGDGDGDGGGSGPGNDGSGGGAGAADSGRDPLSLTGFAADHGWLALTLLCVGLIVVGVTRAHRRASTGTA